MKVISHHFDIMNKVILPLQCVGRMYNVPTCLSMLLFVFILDVSMHELYFDAYGLH